MIGGQGGFLAAALALGLGFVVACGSAQQGGSSPGHAGTAGSNSSAAGGQSGAVSSAPIPLTDLCPVFVGDLCAYLSQCLGEKFRDIDQCKAEVDCYGLPELQAAAAKGSVVYDPSQVGQCHARFL